MIQKFEISTVIELNASDFTENEYKYPNGTIYEFPKGWESYWKNSLKDSGLHNLEQLITGYPFVDITKIDIDALQIIIEKQLDDINLKKLDEIICFEGGIVVQTNGINIVPQCCTSIGDYHELIEVINNKPSEWTDIWIGHPWVFARVKEGLIEFSDYCELNNYDGPPKFKIDFKTFETELLKAIHEINAFKNKVEEVLKKMKIKNHTKIAKILVENNAQ